MVALDAKRNYDNPLQVQVFARLGQPTAPSRRRPNVQLTVDGVVKSVAGVQLAPERWADAAWARGHPGEADANYPAKASVQFTVDMPASGIVRVEQVNKGNDLLPPPTTPRPWSCRRPRRCRCCW